MTVKPATLPVETALIPWASTWSWRHDGTSIDPPWASAAFDGRTWATGPAPRSVGRAAAPTADDLVVEAIASDGVVLCLTPGRAVTAAETHLDYPTAADLWFGLRASLVTRGTPRPGFEDDR